MCKKIIFLINKFTFLGKSCHSFSGGHWRKGKSNWNALIKEEKGKHKNKDGVSGESLAIIRAQQGGDCDKRKDPIPKNVKSKQAVAQTEIPLSGH